MLKEKCADDITIIGGGVIPDEDISKLEGIGVKKVFLPGTPLEEVVKWTEENVKPLRDRLSPSSK